MEHFPKLKESIRATLKLYQGGLATGEERREARKFAAIIAALEPEDLEIFRLAARVRAHGADPREILTAALESDLEEGQGAG